MENSVFVQRHVEIELDHNDNHNQVERSLNRRFAAASETATTETHRASLTVVNADELSGLLQALSRTICRQASGNIQAQLVWGVTHAGTVADSPIFSPTHQQQSYGWHLANERGTAAPASTSMPVSVSMSHTRCSPHYIVKYAPNVHLNEYHGCDLDFQIGFGVAYGAPAASNE